MKALILTLSFVFSSFCFAQNTGSILGIVLDGESFNEPLMYANVSIEGTTMKSTSDTDGLFHFDNLTNGDYTLIFSFNGYETKTLDVRVTSNNQANISASLVARTLSLGDLASVNKAAEDKDKASIVLGN